MRDRVVSQSIHKLQLCLSKFSTLPTSSKHCPPRWVRKELLLCEFFHIVFLCSPLYPDKNNLRYMEDLFQPIESPYEQS